MSCDSPPVGEAPQFEEPTGILAFPDVVELILLKNPYLESFSWEIRAAEARTIQAGVRPNPEFSVQADEIRWQPGPETVTRMVRLGDTIEAERRVEQGERSGFSDAEITLQLSQDIELGKKRSRRRDLAERERHTAVWDHEVAKAEVLSTARRDFVEILVLQERLQRADEPIQYAQELVDRVTRAGLDVAALNEANVDLSKLKIEREHARQELNAARVRLASSWGSTEPGFERAAGELGTLYPVPSEAELLQRIGDNPEVARWAAEIDARKAAVALEKANAVPDLEARIAFKSDMLRTRHARGIDLRPDRLRFEDRRTVYDRARDDTLMLEFSIPLPLFDRNQGTIGEMRSLMRKAEAESQAVNVRVRMEVLSLRALLAASHAEITMLDTEILPAIANTLDAAEKGTGLGGRTYFDVVDAARDLHDARQDRLDALLLYHQTVADLEKLLGGPLVPGH